MFAAANIIIGFIIATADFKERNVCMLICVRSGKHNYRVYNRDSRFKERNVCMLICVSSGKHKYRVYNRDSRFKERNVVC